MKKDLAFVTSIQKSNWENVLMLILTLSTFVATLINPATPPRSSRRFYKKQNWILCSFNFLSFLTLFHWSRLKLNCKQRGYLYVHSCLSLLINYSLVTLGFPGNEIWARPVYTILRIVKLCISTCIFWPSVEPFQLDSKKSKKVDTKIDKLLRLRNFWARHL